MDGDDMEAAIALGGQVVVRIESVRPVGQIIEDTVRGFRETIVKCMVAIGATLGQDLCP